MGWRYDKATGVWRADSYADLNYDEINNLAEYGQPRNPYQPGFVHDHDPDFGNIAVEMSQLEVMNNGYGRAITADKFPVVGRFLRDKLSFPPGTYSLDDLIARGFARAGDKWIRSHLYGFGEYGITAGAIAAADAAYIHGTVSFALMAGTRFVLASRVRRVEAEIGAGDDNWDFNSGTVPRAVNAAVATLFGPDHYNLTAPIRIRFRGPGKRSVAERLTP